MTPLPDHLKAKALIAPPPELAHYLAQHVEAFVWRGHRPPAGRAKLFGAADQRPASCQAERALRMRDNPVTYTATGHPLRQVNRAPGPGEYRIDDGKITLSEADVAETITVRYGFPHR